MDSKRENILAPDEIVTEIQVSYPKPGSAGFYYKMRERQAWDHAIVSIATLVTRRAAKPARTRALCSAELPRFHGGR